MQKFTTNLKQNNKNVWITKQKKNKETAYPSSGHANCYDIEDVSFWFNHRNNSILAMVEKFPPKGPIFDIGGGNGFVSQILNNNGLSTVLIEPGKAGVLNAIKRGIPHIIQATFQEAKFMHASIPAVGVFDVIEHIQDDKKFIISIRDILQPGGKIFITVPAFSILWSHQDIYAQHYKRYTTKEITQLLKDVGFKIDYCSYFFSFLFIPLLLLRSIPFQLKLIHNYTSEQFKKEMNPRLGIFSLIIKLFAEFELYFLRKKVRLLYGTSIIVTAHKI